MDSYALARCGQCARHTRGSLCRAESSTGRTINLRIGTSSTLQERPRRRAQAGHGPLRRSERLDGAAR